MDSAMGTLYRRRNLAIATVNRRRDLLMDTVYREREENLTTTIPFTDVPESVANEHHESTACISQTHKPHTHYLLVQP